MSPLPVASEDSPKPAPHQVGQDAAPRRGYPHRPRNVAHVNAAAARIATHSRRRPHLHRPGHIPPTVTMPLALLTIISPPPLGQSPACPRSRYARRRPRYSRRPCPPVWFAKISPPLVSSTASPFTVLTVMCPRPGWSISAIRPHVPRARRRHRSPACNRPWNAVHRQRPRARIHCERPIDAVGLHRAVGSRDLRAARAGVFSDTAATIGPGGAVTTVVEPNSVHPDCIPFVWPGRLPLRNAHSPSRSQRIAGSRLSRSCLPA